MDPCLETSRLSEAFSFRIESLMVVENGASVTYTVDVNYRYRDELTSDQYPDYIPIYEQVKAFLAEYPGPATDYIEIRNRQLVALLMEKWPVIEELTVAIAGKATATDPVAYSSTVRICRVP